MIDRRSFISSLAGGLLAAPFAVFAQQPARVPRIGVLGNLAGHPLWEDFRRGLRDLGYAEGRTIVIEWRFAEGKPERFPALALELVQLKVDLIVATGTDAAQAARQIASSMPVVMTNSAFPDKLGLVRSLARPDGNITGLSNVAPDLLGKRLELIKQIAPKVARLAVLWNPASPVEPFAFRDLLALAHVAGVEVQSVELQTPDGYSAALATVTERRADALYPLGSIAAWKNRQMIADFALKSRLPSIYEERVFVEAGGLLSYGPSFADLYRRAATYVDKILKGANPGDLPIEQPTKLELVINAKSAKALGLAIPDALRLRADEVIQ